MNKKRKGMTTFPEEVARTGIEPATQGFSDPFGVKL